MDRVPPLQAAHVLTPLPLSRRQLLQAAAALPVVSTIGGCASSGTATSAVLASPADFAAARWATGGTRAITAAARAVQPFSSAIGDCQLTCEATIGPCHTTSVERRDISDGWDGLPLHMVLRVVNAQCQPMAGALVEIWHTNHTGGYSGQIVPMCNNNADDLQRQFFRGWQRTDAQGVVRFDSCYPGWYGGRANHVHLRILQGDYVADDRAPAWAITQLLFPDALNAAIFAKQPLYRDKGQPDTTLDTDNVVGNEPDKSPYVFEILAVDGVMVASKTLTLRSSLDAPSCEVQGKMPAGFPGGRGGPPPGGFPPGGMPPQGVPPQGFSPGRMRPHMPMSAPGTGTGAGTGSPPR